jgi:hypothetical protein
MKKSERRRHSGDWGPDEKGIENIAQINRMGVRGLD